MKKYILTHSGIDIEWFRSTDNDMFPNAIDYPCFFDNNLLSPSRTIKYFPPDPHSNIRVFYYHLFKYSYGTNYEGVESVKGPLERFVEIVFDERFEIRFSRETQQQRELFNDVQFKRFLAQFLLELDMDGDIERMINTFPIMDSVLTHVFRSILSAMGIDEEFQQKIQTELVFQALSEVLEINIAKYGDCWKFQDSDMFCLDQDGSLYFVFTTENIYANLTNSHEYRQCLSILTPIEEHTETSTSKQINNLGFTFGKDEISHVLERSKNLFCYIQHSSSAQNSYENSLFIRNHEEIKNDISRLEMSAEKLISNSIVKGKNQQNQGMYLPEFSVLSHRNSKKTSSTPSSNSGIINKDNYTFISKEDKLIEEEMSTIQPTMLSRKSYGNNVYTSYSVDTSEIELETQKVSRVESNILNRQALDFLSYSPKQTKQIEQPKTKPPVVSKFATNKSSIAQEYYQDFTSSFLLSIIRQPFQSNVRGIKNRVKGMRRDNIKQVF